MADMARTIHLILLQQNVNQQFLKVGQVKLNFCFLSTLYILGTPNTSVGFVLIEAAPGSSPGPQPFAE